MKIIVNGRNIDLTDAIKTYVNEKFERLDHHFDFVQEVHVFLSVEKNPRISESQLAEATVHVRGAVVRVEAASDNLYASIDNLVDRVDRSLRKHKTKILNKTKHPKDSSIRRAGFEEAVAEGEALRSQEEELEGVFITYEDEAEEADETVKTS